MYDEHDALIQAVAGWVERSEQNLSVAAGLVRRKKCPVEIACFLAQQSIEMIMKALLVAHRIDFPKTHDINRLIELMPEYARPSIDEATRERLMHYAVESRYPDDCIVITVDDAREAVKIARRVRKEVRRFLPKAALSQRRER